jgi:hypothetical protein
MVRLGKSSRCADLLDGCKLTIDDRHVGRVADVLSSPSDKNEGGCFYSCQRYSVGLQAAPAAEKTGTGGLARLSASCTTSSHKQDHAARMWFAACHYQKSFKTILQVHVYDPPANTDPVILAQHFHGRPIDIPDSIKATCRFCLRLLVLQ